MHDQDKNILKKYNILCVIVTVKMLLLRFYICKEKCGIDNEVEEFLKCELIRLEVWGKNQGWSNLSGHFLSKAVVSGKVPRGAISTGAQIEKLTTMLACGKVALVYENDNSVTSSTNLTSASLAIS